MKDLFFTIVKTRQLLALAVDYMRLGKNKPSKLVEKVKIVEAYRVGFVTDSSIGKQT